MRKMMLETKEIKKSTILMKSGRVVKKEEEKREEK